MILPSRLTIGLSVALAVSAVANVFLLWQWAQGAPECAAKTTAGALKATQGAEKAEDARDAVSASIARTSDTNAAQTAAQVDSATHADQKDIHNAYFNHDAVPPTGPCFRVGSIPDGVQDAIDRARSRANAASGQLPATGNAAHPEGSGKK